MNAQQALAIAKQAGIGIRVQGDKLKLNAKREPSPAILLLLRNHKAEIIALLSRPPTICRRLAALGTNVDPCPGFSRDPLSRCAGQRWVEVSHRALLFLEHHEAEAVAHGWSEIELVGVHPVVGVRRLDYTGALLIGRSDAVAIDAQCLRYGNGLIYRRQPMPADCVPVWEVATKTMIVGAKEDRPGRGNDRR